MTIKISEVTTTRVGTAYSLAYKDYNLTLCTEDKIPGLNISLSGQLYADSIYCPDDYDFKVYGNYGSESTTSVQISLNKCSVGACADNNTMNAYLDFTR
jgi:hypothetical protein